MKEKLNPYIYASINYTVLGTIITEDNEEYLQLSSGRIIQFDLSKTAKE